MRRRYPLAALLFVGVGCESKEASPQSSIVSVEAPEPDTESPSATEDTESPPTGAGTETGDDEAACAPYPWDEREAGDAIDTPVGPQVDDVAAAAARAASFVERPHTAAAIWRDGDTYKVVTPRGATQFSRTRDADGDWVLAWADEPPLNTDSMVDVTLADALSHGNPSGTDYSAHGYAADDPRLSFASLADTAYPNLMRRFSSLFDGEDAPGMAVLLAPYAKGGVGSHGDADGAQSRAPLVIRGPGVLPGRVPAAANHVDIAPTVAGLMGVNPVRGVDGRTGRWTENQMMRWQDGAVLTEAIEETCAYGAATYGLVIVLDGLNHTELLDGIEAGRYPNLARIVDEQAAIFEGGSVVGWPSFSLPGHVSIFTGAWQGHHGLISNSFVDQSTGETGPGAGLSEMLLSPETASAVMAEYLSSDVETVFEAVARSRPGARLAAVNELTTRGANLGAMSGKTPPPPTDLSVYTLADEYGVAQAAALFAEGVPDFMAISLYLTDGAGQNVGPHGDGAREFIVETDERVGRVLDLYEAAGVLDDTVVVLTADHGMSLMDSSRPASWTDVFDGAKLVGQMVYDL
jgi:phosphonoacetate hydrolase